MMAGEKDLISPENRGPILNIVNWIILVVMCLAVLVKVFSKWTLIHALRLDDFYMIAALVFSKNKISFTCH